MPKLPSFWASVVLLTCLGYFAFPGHTYLQADTQIYVPMTEHVDNPILFTEDLLASRPYLSLTAYDEITIALRNYFGLDFEHGLKSQQVLFRGCEAAGLLLIASGLGLALPEAFLVAGLAILNQSSLGIEITALEPIPRAFAMGLLLLAVGLAVNGSFLLAGLIAALGFLIHPSTTTPFWIVAAMVVWRKAARPLLLAPLLPAAGAMLLLIHFQAGVTEPLDFFRQLDPFQEGLQRYYMRPVFVSEWTAKEIADCLCECAVACVGFWRLRKRIQTPVREWLLGLAAVGVLSIPFSWIMLDQLHWAMVGPWSPIRATVFIAMLASLFSGACGILASRNGIWWEAAVWFAIALALPLKGFLATWFVDPRLIVLALGLMGVCVVGGWLAGRTRGCSLIAAGVLMFLALPASSLVPYPKPVDTPELRELAEWAQAKTNETAVFLFADNGFDGGSGPFRARALRSVYVDYEGRALVNFYAEFSAEWSSRWQDVHRGRWQVGPQDFQQLREWHIDFVVLQKEHAIPTKQPEFSNTEYVVYRVFN